MNNTDHNTHDDDTEVIAQQDAAGDVTTEDVTTEMDMPLSERFADFDVDAAAAPTPDDGDTREMPAQSRIDDATTVVIEQTGGDDLAPTCVMPQQDADDKTQPLTTVQSAGWSWSSDAAPAITATDDDTATLDTATLDDTVLDTTTFGTETLDVTVVDEDAAEATTSVADTTAAATPPSEPTPPSAVPMYSAPQPAEEPKIVRPSGASAGTIAFGVVVTIFGALTILVGATMNSGLLDYIDWRGIVNWTLMGLGVLLSVVAIVWGLIAHVRGRRRDERRTDR